MNLEPSKRILIRGNHEWCLKHVIDSKRIQQHDIHNGTDITYNRLKELNLIDLFNDYFNTCLNYYEIEDYVFTHGWMTDIRENLDTFTDKDWEEATWVDYRDSIYYPVYGKVVVCGHRSPVFIRAALIPDKYSYINNLYELPKKELKWLTEPLELSNLIEIDALTVCTHIVNCYVI